MILAIALCGCGGGGGSDGESPAEDYTGVWSGRMGQLDNICVAAGLGDFDFTMTVNQDGDRVVVDSSTGATFEGNIKQSSIDHEDELDVVKPVACNSGEVGQTTTEILLSKHAGEDDSGVGVIEVTTTCGGGSLSCRWVGNMTRNS
jgi:hypothetical protein